MHDQAPEPPEPFNMPLAVEQIANIEFSEQEEVVDGEISFYPIPVLKNPEKDIFSWIIKYKEWYEQYSQGKLTALWHRNED